MKSGSMNDYLGHRQQGGWSSSNQMVKFLSCHHWTGCVMCYLMAHELIFKAMTSWFSEAESDSVESGFSDGHTESLKIHTSSRL